VAVIPKYGLTTAMMTKMMVTAMTISDNKNNKGVNLMFNSKLTTKAALKWVHTKLKLKGMHHTTKHTGRIEVTYHAFLTLTPNTSKWLSSSSNCFTPRALLPTGGKRVRSSRCSSHSVPPTVGT